jgi:hypothetical protein
MLTIGGLTSDGEPTAGGGLMIEPSVIKHRSAVFAYSRKKEESACDVPIGQGLLWRSVRWCC